VERQSRGRDKRLRNRRALRALQGKPYPTILPITDGWAQLLIADDRVVICGSANLNDRSQLGDHDSELAIVISSPPTLPSRMHGRAHNVCPFAASLRRFVFRKHLGLAAPQDPRRPDDGFFPAGVASNLGAAYDFGSAGDVAVEDPLDAAFERAWDVTARANTAVFDKAFHVVPSDRVRSWRDYDEFYEKNFRAGDEKKGVAPGPYGVGHVVREEFPGGVAELKRELAKVRGSLVEMPLLFLKDEKDFVGQGLALNSFTEEVYT
jgi:phospholipase D1/2